MKIKPKLQRCSLRVATPLAVINASWGDWNVLLAISFRRVPYTGTETPVPRCPSAEKSQRWNGERRNGGAETVAPKLRRRNVTYSTQYLYSKPRPMLVVQKWCIYILIMYFCIMFIFLRELSCRPTAWLPDFAHWCQIFQLGSHDVLKIQVYWETCWIVSC